MEDLPLSNQEQYNLLMELVDDTIAAIAATNFTGVVRQTEDCARLAALITAAQNLFTQKCPIA